MKNMKKTLTNFALFAVLMNFIVQNVNAQSPTDYRRSSLSFILMEHSGLGQSRDLVVKSYEDNPFPEEYNKHVLKDQKFIFEDLNPTTEDLMASGFYQDTLKSFKDFLKALKNPLRPLRYTKADSSEAVQEPSEFDMVQIKIDKFLREKDIAKQMVASWFNRDPETGKMDFELVKERGKYSASEEKLDQAKTVADEGEFLKDMELLGNTYTVINKMEFYANEPVARLIADAAKEELLKSMAGSPQVLIDKGLAGIEKIYEKTKEGYTVKCNSYLYQLNWDEDVAAKTKSYFFNENVDSKAAWDTTSLFKLSFVGNTTSLSLVTFKLGEKRTEEDIINLQVKRTMDNAIAKLQKKYVQFRAVAPIASVEPLTARIGLKQGVEPKQKWEILEMSFNELGLPVWKSIGKISVDKKAPIWDNTYGAETPVDESGNPVEVQKFSTFTGGKKAQPGLHFIRLVK